MVEGNFTPIRTMTIIKDYEVVAHFCNGVAKTYDFKNLFDTFEPLKILGEDYQLFKSFQIRGGDIYWTDELDLAAEEIWDNGTFVFTPFDGLMSFNEATEEWNLSNSTLRKAIQYGKLKNGIDAMNFGKQWVVSREAMEREYGPSPRENPVIDEETPPIIKHKKPVITQFYGLTIEFPISDSYTPFVVVKSERGTESLLNVESMVLYNGGLTETEGELVIEWAMKHQAALLKMLKTKKFKNLPTLL